MDKIKMTKTNNRRGFFRIYEEVNLFYKKIDQNQVNDPRPVFEAVLNETSSSMDLNRAPLHDTRNVNISASGMAFTCEDALQEGDYLAINMQLASRSTDISAYAQVVYCKNSPVNDSQYPYFIGAHFINMNDDERAVLINYVDKKRLQQTWVNGVILAVVLTVIAAPAAIFGLLLELSHFLLELFLELSHLAFEFIESNLDKLVEHLFETDLHLTQVIVFYIIFSFVVYGCYRLWRIVPRSWLRFKRNQIAYWSRKQASLLYFWREQSLFNKIKLLVIGVAAITGYVFFGI